MQFSAIYGEVANQFDSQAVTRVKLWCNQAAHEFYDRRKFAWRETRATFATASGQQDYVLAGASPVIPDFDGIAAGVRHNLSNGGTFKPRLKEMWADDFDDWFGLCGPVAGVPAVVTLRGATGASTSAGVHSGGEQVLSFFPVMNFVGSCDLSYYRAAGSIEMVNDTDVPLAPVQYHRVIVDLATAIGLTAEDQMIQASTYTNRAEAMIQAAISADVALRRAERARQPGRGETPVTDPRQGPPYGFDENR